MTWQNWKLTMWQHRRPTKWWRIGPTAWLHRRPFGGRCRGTSGGKRVFTDTLQQDRSWRPVFPDTIGDDDRIWRFVLSDTLSDERKRKAGLLRHPTERAGRESMSGLTSCEDAGREEPTG